MLHYWVVFLATAEILFTLMQADNTFNMMNLHF